MKDGETHSHFYFHFHFDFQCVRFRLECVARQQLTFSIFRLPGFLFPFCHCAFHCCCPPSSPALVVVVALTVSVLSPLSASLQDIYEY